MLCALFVLHLRHGTRWLAAGHAPRVTRCVGRTHRACHAVAMACRQYVIVLLLASYVVSIWAAGIVSEPVQANARGTWHIERGVHRTVSSSPKPRLAEPGCSTSLVSAPAAPSSPFLNEVAFDWDRNSVLVLGQNPGHDYLPNSYLVALGACADVS